MSAQRKQHQLQQWVLDKRDIQAIREGRSFRDGVLPPEPPKKAVPRESVFFDDEASPKPSQQRAREKFHGLQGFLRGHRNEARLVEIVEHIAQNRVSWIYGVRLATLEEDAQKIDVVVTTDLGDLYLQSKSSHKGLKKFDQSKYPHIACIIVHNGEHLADEVLEKLEYLRAWKVFPPAPDVL